jgi:putative DNA primase/helicase
MARKRHGEKVERLGGKEKQHNVARFEELRRRIVRWAQDNRALVAQAEPEVPESLDDRAAANWRVLLAIGDALSPEWAKLARDAAEELSNGRTEDGDSAGLQLLGDLRATFVSRAADELSSGEICGSLNGMEDRPWPEFGRGGKPLTQVQLARLLRPFAIYPTNLRTEGGVLKGYRLKDCEDAFLRYLPDLAKSNRCNATAAGGVRENDDFATATNADCSASKNAQNAYGENGCSGVADENHEDPFSTQKHGRNGPDREVVK